jgi:hypothetical protein
VALLEVVNGGGWKDTVLWSPLGSEAMGFDRFLCVESAAIDPVALAPGQQWTATCSLVPTPLRIVEHLPGFHKRF